MAPIAHAAPTPSGEQPADLRAAYHVLLTREDSPALRAYARRYTRTWLARSEYRIGADGRLPARWHAGTGLREWLDAEHERTGEQFEGDDHPPMPSREELIRSTVQLAPLIMIDGGWLQGFTDYRFASSATGHLLFRTYWDELGNGQRDLNHPRIYRELLADMGIELPPTGSLAFAGWSGFDDQAFALPVYWLSVSRFPRSHLPEILGLNLAMELSGVGGGYRESRIALKKHGFSTQFVDLHNTIDNVATGHSAWAADAIDTHLAGLDATTSDDEVQRVWRRVRVGYRSLNPPAGVGARTWSALRAKSTRPRAAANERG